MQKIQVPFVVNIDSEFSGDWLTIIREVQIILFLENDAYVNDDIFMYVFLKEKYR